MGRRPVRGGCQAAGVRDRPKRDDLMRAARRRELDLILVWRLDRWGRSLVDLITTLQELTAASGRLRLARRGHRPDHAERPGPGRHARGLRRVRAGHPPRSREGRDRPGPQGGSPSRQAADDRQACRRGEKALPTGCQQAGDRQEARHQQDFRPTIPRETATLSVQFCPFRGVTPIGCSGVGVSEYRSRYDAMRNSAGWQDRERLGFPAVEW